LPRVTLDDGLKATIGYFELKLSVPSVERRGAASRNPSRQPSALRDIGREAVVQ